MSTTTITLPATLTPGAMIEHVFEDKHILIARVGDKYYATNNICSHARVLLSLGKLRGHTVICPLHGARFDIRTGKCVSGPASMNIASYPVTQTQAHIVVDLEHSTTISARDKR